MAEAILGDFADTNAPHSSIAKVDVPAVLTQTSITGKLIENIERFELRMVLIEDVDDLLVGLRGDVGLHAQWRKFLRRSDVCRVTVGTARRPERLEHNELDAFQARFPMLYPDEDTRRAIVVAYAKKFEVDLPDAGGLAKRTEWWSSGELARFVERVRQENHSSESARIRLIEVLQDMINTEERISRTVALLRFTAEHCTSDTSRRELRERYQDLLRQAELADSSAAHITYNSNYITTLLHKGDNVMGDYIRTGNVTGGIVGKAINNSTVVNQGDGYELDIRALLPEMIRLREEMLQRAKTPEHFVAIGALAEAELSAKEGNTSTVLGHLRKAGHWALEVASGIGIRVAASAITTALQRP